MKVQLEEKFKEKYNKSAQSVYFTPGRVNLIGEHIDYNGGLVMPCAVTMGTWLLVAPNNDNVIRFKCENFTEEAEFPIQTAYTKDGSEWFYYPLGAFNEIAKLGKSFTGVDLLFYGNIPIGSGLSSSASISVATLFALNDYFNFGYDKLEIVKLAKSIENNFIGVNCGIMDQFAVAFGEKDKAIVLNCDSLEYQIVDCNLDGYVLAIINTNKPRKLAESKYNERVSECKEALAALNQEVKLDYLCELNADDFSKLSHLITNPIVLKRAKHVVEENDRVHLAAKALNNGNLQEFGNLMYASHQSLKDQYEVSGMELDTIVDFCKDYEHVSGARMTGAGFGGCAIALLKKGYEADFTQKITDYYTNRVGYPTTVYVSEIGNGSSKI